LKKTLVLFLLILATLVSRDVFAEEKINSVPNRAATPPLLTIDKQGNLFVLHYGDDEFLHIIKNSQLVKKMKKDGAAGSFIWFGFPDGNPSLVWRPKLAEGGKKYIYFQRADENLQIFEKETVLNSAKDALLPITVAQKDEKLFVMWADERKMPPSLFLNYSTDYGRTFRNEDIPVTPGYAATLARIALTDKQVYCLFVGRKEGEDKTGIYVASSLNGVEWSDPQLLETYEEWSPAAIETVVADDSPVMVWAGARGIGYAYPDAEGKWHSQLIEQTKDMDINRIKLTRAENGSLFLLTSYKRFGDTAKKPSVFLLTSSNGGRTWSEPIRVNHNKYENTSAWLPDMHIRDDGTIVVVWQDHRFIRGNIYMNYSKDAGKTWLSEDINLDDEPGKHNDYYPYVTGYKDKVYVLIPRYQSDSLDTDKIDLYLKEVKING